MSKWKIVDHPDIPGLILIEGPAFRLVICAQASNITASDYLRIMADARLIAAAPEMLELLRDVRQYVADANLRGEGYAEIHLKAIDALPAFIKEEKMSKQWSQNTQEWMDALGGFGPTANNEHVKGYTCDENGEGSKTYWSAEDLREIAAACLEVAESLEGGEK